jgi:ABC-type sugar transport system substrate-binding protein
MAKGIKVVDSANGSFNNPLGGLFAHVSADFRKAGALDVDYALSTAGCSAPIALLYGSVYEHDVDVKDGVKAELKELCPGCKLESTDVPLSQFTPQGVQLLASTLLRRTPSIKTLIGANDFLGLDALPPSSSAAGDVKVISNNGDEENLELLANGKGHQGAVVSLPPPAYIGWVALDYVIRAIDGSASEAFALPQQVFVKDNLDLTTPFPSIGDYQTAFKQLWGVS